jgi:diadenosine tetraphosphate (Ap4A) HIT family hydrolase
MESCFYCEENEKLNSMMLKIKELHWSMVYLNRNQTLPGRCIVAYREHKTEYFELTTEANAGFFFEVSITAQAIKNVFNPDKINYATYGDLVPHAHFHLVPKYKNKIYWGNPFQDEPKETLSDTQYMEMIEKLNAEIEKLIKMQNTATNKE